MKIGEKVGEKGLLAIAILLSSIWLAAVPVIYFLLKEWRKKRKNGTKKQDLGDTGESENGLPPGESGERSTKESI